MQLISSALPILVGKEKQSKGVEVFEKKKIGEETAFRGVATLSGSQEQFLKVIHETNRWKHWVENLKSGELIEKKSETHHIFRQVIGTPFPMKDREAVFESKIQQLNPSSTLVKMKSVDHPSVKRSTDQIRVEIVYSQYHIEKNWRSRLRVTFEKSFEKFRGHSKIPDPLGIALPGYSSQRDPEEINQLKIKVPLP